MADLVPRERIEWPIPLSRDQEARRMFAGGEVGLRRTR